MSSTEPPISKVSAIKAGAKLKEKGKENASELRRTAANSSSGVSGASSSLHLQTAISDFESEWPWTTIVDTSVGSHPPVFTSDGNYFFSVVGSTVRIYSVASGRVVSTLSSSSIGSSGSRVATGGHSDVITSAILNPDDPFQLLTASLDGDIKRWNFLDAVLVETIHIGNPISHMCAHSKFKGQVFIAVPTKLKKNAGNSSFETGNAMIFRVSLKQKEASASGRCRSSEIIRIGKAKATVALDISPSGSWLVVVAGHKAYVCHTSSLESGFTKFVSPEKLTCLAFHPSEDYFATGDELGQIRLWYCLNSQLTSGNATRERKAQTTTMHWHAHAVSSLSFSRNGSYLLSGGEESVLVIWQIQTGRKEFVPRLGSPILTIKVRTSDDIEEYLVGLADGSYLFINSGTLDVTRAISCLRLDPRGIGRPAHTPIPLAAHRNTSTLILPASHPSSIQIFSPSSSALSELEVSSSNRVSRRDEKDIQFARVDFAVVSFSGDWMATVDARDNDDEFTAEINLKIWRWDSSTWVLNTRIERPHGSKRVATVDFLPQTEGKDKELLMTVGRDGTVKTWCIRTIAAKDGTTEDFWINRSILSFRSETPTDAHWSPDGSLLAVAFGRQIALYDPHSNVLLDCLVTMDIRSIDTVRFVGRTGRFLLANGRNNAILWDLVTRRVCWHYYTPFTIAQSLAHPQDDSVVLIAQPFTEDDAVRSCKVLHFSATSPNPFSVKTLPFRFRVVDWNRLHSGGCSLIGITYSWNVVVCGDDSQGASNVVDEPREIDRTTGLLPKNTLFQDIFGKSALLDTGEDEALVPRAAVSSDYASGSTDKQSILSLFEVPAYLAPPLETVYSGLIGSFLRKPQVYIEPEMPQENDETEDMVVDNEPAPLPYRQRTVQDSEFNSLVDLFRKQTIDKSPRIDNPNGIINGTSKIYSNGIRSSVTTQSHPPTPQSPETNMISSRSKSQNQIPSPQPSTAATAGVLGQKRKKSIS